MAVLLDHDAGALKAEYLIPIEDNDYQLMEVDGMIKSHRLYAER